jgi:hypothetical protein
LAANAPYILLFLSFVIFVGENGEKKKREKAVKDTSVGAHASRHLTSDT